jgi:hypothetical protein
MLFYRFGDFGVLAQCRHRMLPGKETKALAETKVARKVVMHWVAENLYRLESSGGYYALLKRGDKQFRRSLRTKDQKLVHAQIQISSRKHPTSKFQPFRDNSK